MAEPAGDPQPAAEDEDPHQGNREDETRDTDGTEDEDCAHGQCGGSREVPDGLRMRPAVPSIVACEWRMVCYLRHDQPVASTGSERPPSATAASMPRQAVMMIVSTLVASF